TATGVAIAALNIAIGLGVDAHPEVVEVPETPPLDGSLHDWLRAAMDQRRELQAAQRAIESAQEGRTVARGSFAPRIVAEGSLLDYQQANPRGRADLALGLFRVEWVLFEGGKRVAEVRVADSRIRAALAQADALAQTVALQVSQAYQQA